jgi:putative flippase GtrA
MPKLIDKLPPVLANRLKATVIRQFARFALVACVSLAASELTLSVAYLAGATGGVAGLCGWLVGAGTSYLLSRWAWRRKGRPHLLKETLPFWAISIGTAAVLSVTTHFAASYAKHHGMPRHQAVIVVAVAYLIANFVTFMTRFLIFHYVLFADGREPATGGAQSAAPSGIEGEALSPISAMVPGGDEIDERPLSHSGPAALTPPRAGDDPCEVQAVQRVVALLAVPDLALVDGRGPLRHAVTMR